MHQSRIWWLRHSVGMQDQDGLFIWFRQHTGHLWGIRLPKRSLYITGYVLTIAVPQYWPNGPEKIDRYIVLTGSCGLEYTIDYTETGKAQKQNGYWHSSGNYNESSGSSWIFPVVLVISIFLLIRCLSTGSTDTSSSRDADQPSGRNSRTPPPYGFKPEYTSGTFSYLLSSPTEFIICLISFT